MVRYLITTNWSFNLKILAIFAHPDDETMLCGGLLALASSTGHSVHVVSATRGEGGDLGSPPVCRRSEAGTVRARELACAARALGCRQLSFMDYVDPMVGAQDELFPFAADEAEFTVRLAALIAAEQADALLTHGTDGEYGHPGHRQVNRAARAALRSLKDRPVWYTVQAAYDSAGDRSLFNASDPADFVLDVSGAQAAKRAAIECHRTQHAVFLNFYRRLHGRAVNLDEVVLLAESIHHAGESSCGADPLKDWLRIQPWAREVNR
jgi:LmbE family N-acetylglucosaminyl deacetylase